MGGRATATLRFYEELNDFLPAEWRKRDAAVEVDRARSVKDAIESAARRSCACGRGRFAIPASSPSAATARGAGRPFHALPRAQRAAGGREERGGDRAPAGSGPQGLRQVQALPGMSSDVLGRSHFERIAKVLRRFDAQNPTRAQGLIPPAD
jgi:hypothetical protein